MGLKQISSTAKLKKLINEMPAISKEDENAGAEIIKQMFTRFHNNYFVLSCSEPRCSILFNFNGATRTNEYIENMVKGVIDYLHSLGTVKSIEISIYKNTIEICINSSIFYLSRFTQEKSY